MTRHRKAPASTCAPINSDSSSSQLGDSSSITADASQRPGEETSETTFAGEAVQQIEALIESFRMGNTTKSQTIVKISQVLTTETTGDEQLKANSLERYITMLDGIETIAAESD